MATRGYSARWVLAIVATWFLVFTRMFFSSKPIFVKYSSFHGMRISPYIIYIHESGIE